MEDLTITVNDLRKAGYCLAGARRWAQARGLDFRIFVRDGIPASRLRDLNDALADAVISRTEARRDDGGR